MTKDSVLINKCQQHNIITCMNCRVGVKDLRRHLDEIHGFSKTDYLSKEF